MKANRKRIIKIALIIVIIIAIMVNMVTIKPIHLNTKGVEEIFVAVMIDTNRLTFDGEATVSKRRDIADVVKRLNNIKTFRWGRYSVYDLEGDSPTAWIDLFDQEREVVDSIYFYQNILSYGNKFYKISMSEYDCLLKICKEYGEFQE